MMRTVQALSETYKGDGRLILQCPVWSELVTSGKRQGRNRKKKYRKGRDLKVDIVVERHFGAVQASNVDDVVGVEVDGPGHNTKDAKDRDGKKKKSGFYIHPVTVAKMYDSSDYTAEAEKALSAWIV